MQIQAIRRSSWPCCNLIRTVRTWRRFLRITRHVQTLKMFENNNDIQSIKPLFHALCPWHFIKPETAFWSWFKVAQQPEKLPECSANIVFDYFAIIKYFSKQILNNEHIKVKIYIYFMYWELQQLTFCKAAMNRTDGFLLGSAGDTIRISIRSSSPGILTWRANPFPDPENSKQMEIRS